VAAVSGFIAGTKSVYKCQLSAFCPGIDISEDINPSMGRIADRQALSVVLIGGRDCCRHSNGGRSWAELLIGAAF